MRRKLGLMKQRSRVFEAIVGSLIVVLLLCAAAGPQASSEIKPAKETLVYAGTSKGSNSSGCRRRTSKFPKISLWFHWDWRQTRRILRSSSLTSSAGGSFA